MCKRELIPKKDKWGVKTCMGRVGLYFKGQKHDALDDIVATVTLIQFLAGVREKEE